MTTKETGIESYNKDALHAIALLEKGQNEITLHVEGDEARERLKEALEQSLQNSNKEYTTQQAADFLNVSRPFVIKLLDQGKIPYRKVGKHRRVAFHDLRVFKEIESKKQEKAMDDLISEAQKYDLGY